MAKIKHQIEHIIWDDHSGGHLQWEDVSAVQADIQNDYFIHTVGIVIAEDKTSIVMVQNLACNDKTCHSMKILKATIKKRTKLGAYVTRNA